MKTITNPHTSHQGRISSIIGTRAMQRTVVHSYTTTHRNKTVEIDKIKHILIVLVLPTKSMYKHAI